MSSDTLAKVGSQTVTDRDMSAAMQRRLAQVREQNPEATYADLAGDFDPLLQGLIDQRALQAFADKHGFVLSKRLVDARNRQYPGSEGAQRRSQRLRLPGFLRPPANDRRRGSNVITGTLARAADGHACGDQRESADRSGTALCVDASGGAQGHRSRWFPLLDRSPPG